MKLSVVIPTYKNTALLFHNLKHNLSFLKNCEVVIVNDDPSQSILQNLKHIDRTLKVVENKTNLGFGESVNKGVRQASSSYVMLLNSDVVLRDDSFYQAFLYFKKMPELFAVSFAQREKDASLVGKNRIFWNKGFFQHTKASNLDLGHNGWAEGGACIIDKKKFNYLKGFDPLYYPFYWEDIDLSYRAWKQGYTVLFDPKIVVDHHHESTIGTYFTRSYIKTIAYRNQILFIWKNISDKTLVLSHVFFLLQYAIITLVKGEFAFIKGLLMAVRSIARIKKIKQPPLTKTDHEILALFK